MNYTGPFDLTFDHTFQYLVPDAGLLQANPCRVPGVHLMWLSLNAWGYYTFSGHVDEDTDVRSLGQFTRAGSDQDWQKADKPILTIRAGGLTKPDSRVLAGIYKSPKVFALAPGVDGKTYVVPVRIEPGTFAVWRDAEGRFKLEAKIIFPEIKTQRV